jgi:hypothetical protein
MVFPKGHVKNTKLKLINYSGGDEQNWKMIPNECSYIKINHSKGDIEWRVFFTSDGRWRTTISFSDGTPEKWVESVFLTSGLRAIRNFQDIYMLR